MGGYSSEYKISLVSGNVVYNFLDQSKFKGYRIHIFKEKVCKAPIRRIISKQTPEIVRKLLCLPNLNPNLPGQGYIEDLVCCEAH